MCQRYHVSAEGQQFSSGVVCLSSKVLPRRLQQLRRLESRAQCSWSEGRLLGRLEYRISEYFMHLLTPHSKTQILA